jgi:hypothetical protein
VNEDICTCRVAVNFSDTLESRLHLAELTHTHTCRKISEPCGIHFLAGETIAAAPRRGGNLSSAGHRSHSSGKFVVGGNQKNITRMVCYNNPAPRFQCEFLQYHVNTLIKFRPHTMNILGDGSTDLRDGLIYNVKAIYIFSSFMVAEASAARYIYSSKLKMVNYWWY